HAGDDVRGEHGDLGVEVADHGVVIAARVLHAVFDLIQRLLELRETFYGAKLRVRFGERENLAEGGREHAFRFGLRGGAFSGHSAVARGDHAFKRAFLMGRVAFYGLDEIGNQVVAALELDINVGPGVVALHPQTHQAVVQADDEDHDQRDDDQENPHGLPPQFAWIGSLP